MTCTLYDEGISYDAPINYNGVCTSPPAPTGNPKGGGTIINVYEHIDPYERKRRREDDEILILKGV